MIDAVVECDNFDLFALVSSQAIHECSFMERQGRGVVCVERI